MTISRVMSNQDAKKRGEEWSGPDYLAMVVPPVLNSLVDADARVRYYACEALYNIAKVSRDDFLEPHFNCTFDALFRLVADPDPAVHQATTFLDALMKVPPSVTLLFQLALFEELEHCHGSIDDML
jgi:vacuole morphology and inheritance protein 14